ncbi:MAG: Ig-like domain-containing protein [Actinobacteria bacterium]|nr:Ig-like domain-containing protein [Actinomycetota bacterium]
MRFSRWWWWAVLCAVLAGACTAAPSSAPVAHRRAGPPLGDRGPARTLHVVHSVDRVEVGETIQLSALVFEPSGESAPVPVTWSLSDPELGTLTDTGRLTPLEAGRVTVTATAPHAVGAVGLEFVRSPVRRVEVDARKLRLGVGERTVLHATVQGPEGIVLHGRQERWSTLDGDVIGVRTDGTVTARAEGRTSVEVRVEGRVARVEVEVVRRATTDRVDDRRGQQVHVVYAVPRDGADRVLDLSGELERSLGSMQAWLSRQTGGRVLRLDTYRGEVDVTFVRLTRKDAGVGHEGRRVYLRIRGMLAQMGLRDSNKIYAVYYDGSSVKDCGRGGGGLAIAFLHGIAIDGRSCSFGRFAPSATSPAGYMEFLILHEILHAAGFVDEDAPHANDQHHVTGPSTDIMFNGPGAWYPSALDPGHDDYFGENVPDGVRNLADSPYLVRARA